MENSPRAISAAPARTRPRVLAPIRLAATHPVTIFPAPVTSSRRAAGTIAAGRSPGSIWKAKKRKNMAANRSRNGSMSSLARSCTGPDRASPTRNAPIAAEICSCWASPPTTRVRPNTASSRASLLPRSSRTLIRWP